MESVRMLKKKHSQRRVFLFAWALVQEKNKTISQALKTAWVAYRHRDVLHLYLTQAELKPLKFRKMPAVLNCSSLSLFK